jgi:hypothetical protein
MMPGFLLQAGDLALVGGRLTYKYDPVALARETPNLDAAVGDAADVVTISLFGWGTRSDGSRGYAARVLVLHGQELFNLPVGP